MRVNTIIDVWQDMAACRGMNTDLFFPRENLGGPREGKGITGERDRASAAKEVCKGCPVRLECLEFAIDHDCTGIWGGMDARERARYARDH
jgi:WhiB family redox-sensing transcriptional regulator